MSKIIRLKTVCSILAIILTLTFSVNTPILCLIKIIMIDK